MAPFLRRYAGKKAAMCYQPISHALGLRDRINNEL